MRPLSAILILLVYLFNLGGYQLMFLHLEKESGRQFMAQIDNNAYDEADLIEIRVPINLPYHQNWADYERYDGEVVVDGVHYSYVKRKLVNDSMSFLCLPNTNRSRLQNARETFFSLVNDIQSDDGKHSPSDPVTKLSKSNVVECNVPEDCLVEKVLFSKINPVVVPVNNHLLESFPDVKDRPPIAA